MKLKLWLLFFACGVVPIKANELVCTSPTMIAFAHSDALSDDDRAEILHNAKNNYILIPESIKKCVRACVCKYPEIVKALDLSLFLSKGKESVHRETAAQIIKNLIDFLSASNLSSPDSDDSMLNTLLDYQLELESLNAGAGTRASQHLFNTNAGLAIAGGGILNISGAHGINTQGAGQTVTVKLDPYIRVTGISVSDFCQGLVNSSPTGALSSCSTGPYILRGLSGGVVTSSPTGVLSAKATNNNAVQIGNSTGTLTSIPVGSNGQVLIGANSAPPAFSTLTSNNGTISFTPGPNTLNLETSLTGAGLANRYPTDAGTASPSGGTLDIRGGSNINTSTGLGSSTVTINLNASPSVTGTITAGGNINAGGNLNVTGDINATGNLRVAGNINASGTITAGNRLVVQNGGINATGPIGFNSLNNGVVTSSATGLISSSATTNNAVQIGNSTGTLTSIPVGTNGQVLIGANGAAPLFATLTSNNGTINFNPGPNSLNLETSITGAGLANRYPTDAGTASPSGGTLDILGGSNINTSTGLGSSTVTINLNASPSVTGTITAGGDINAGGNLNVTGNINATGNLRVAGNINASGAISAGGNINAGGNLNVTGNINATGNLNVAGNINASGTITAGNGLIVQNGGINATGPIDFNSLTGPGAVTVSATGLLGSARATTNGQLLLGVSGGLPFFTGLSSPANPSGATSMIYSSGPSFLSLQSVPLFVNVIRVDWLNGNNSTASVTNGIPFQTISAAMTAISSSGIASNVNPVTVWVMPGIYNENVTLQPYVSLIGMSEGAGLTVTSGGTIPTNVGTSGVTIQRLNTPGGGNLVTMAEYSRIENVSLIINNPSASTSANDTGIFLNGGTINTTARIKNVSININAVGATSGRAVGVRSSDTTGVCGPEIAILEDCSIALTGSNLNALNGIQLNNTTLSSSNININNCAISVSRLDRGSAIGLDVIQPSTPVTITLNNSSIKTACLGSGGSSNLVLRGIFSRDSSGSIILNNSSIEVSSSLDISGGVSNVDGIRTLSDMILNQSSINASISGNLTSGSAQNINGIFSSLSLTLNSSSISVSASNTGSSSVTLDGIRAATNAVINNSKVTTSSSYATTTLSGINNTTSSSLTLNNSSIDMSSTAANSIFGITNGTTAGININNSSITASSTASAIIQGVSNTGTRCTINNSSINVSSANTGTTQPTANYGVISTAGTLTLEDSPINVASTSTGWVYGVYNSGNPCTINASSVRASSNGSGAVNGIFNNGRTCTVTASPITAFSSANGTTFGVVNNSPTGSCFVSSSTVSGNISGVGTSADISQNTGMIVLDNTKLVTNRSNEIGTSNGGNFIGTPTSYIAWSTFGDLSTTSNRSMIPNGSFNPSTGNPGTGLTILKVSNPCIVKNLKASCDTAPGGANSTTFTLLKNNVATPLATTIVGATRFAQLITGIAAFTGGDELRMQLTTTSSATANILVNADVY